MSTFLLIAIESHAIVLGEAKGVVIFGQPLDLTFKIRLDNQSDQPSNCLIADIYQADTVFDAGKTRLTIMTLTNKLETNVRVQSTNYVSEPWIKVILSSQCGLKNSKIYTFLTDFAIDAPPSTASSPEIKNIVEPLATTQLVSAKATALPTPVLKKIKKQISYRTSTILKSDNHIPKSVATQTVKAHLKMETLEIDDELALALRLSNTLLTSSGGTRTLEEARALSQAKVVWLALNGAPLKEGTTPAVYAEENDKTRISSASLAASTTRLAEPTKSYQFMIYSLLSLIAVSLGCLVWFWLRMQKHSPTKGYRWLNKTNHTTQNIAGTSKILPAPLQGKATTIKRHVEPAFQETPTPINVTIEGRPLVALISDAKTLKQEAQKKPSPVLNNAMSAHEKPTMIWAINQSRKPEQSDDSQLETTLFEYATMNKATFTNAPAASISAEDLKTNDKTQLNDSEVVVNVSYEEVSLDLINFDLIYPPTTDKF